MEGLRQRVTVDLPYSDLSFMQNISRDKGWVINVVPIERPRRYDEEAADDVIMSLLGAGEPVPDYDINAREAFHKNLLES